MLVPLPLPWLALALFSPPSGPGSAPAAWSGFQSAPQATDLGAASEQAFEARTGVSLVWAREELPEDVPYATTPTEPPAARKSASAVLAREALKYPPGLLGAIGIHKIGVFAGCGDPDGDGFRPWVDALGGYRYFGRWDPSGHIVACHYSDDQLALTFHHEVFHHIDAVVRGRLAARHSSEDDARWTGVVATPARKAYAAIALSPASRAAIERVAGAAVLRGSVTDYAAKAPGEDQAETAWWFMTHLAEGLLQAADHPELAGSQRILHLLGQYAGAAPKGTRPMDLAWFQQIATGAREGGELARARTNAYLAKVDAEISASGVRSAIRAVQPAVVNIGGGTGVNLRASGLVLTAAHVVDDHRDGRVSVLFPDGVTAWGRVSAFDDARDLALVELVGMTDLPFAPIARVAAVEGSEVIVIGMPGKRTPSGEATGYQPWHVSSGEIRGFLPDRADGDQHLGRAKHDAWTYWGHSGSPLFDTRGAIVALHNSWDSKTAMRHAVPWEAIVKFLETHGIAVARR